MEQDKLAALVKMIMADPRIMALIQNEGKKTDCRDLTLIETKDIFETLPLEQRANVCCQELPGGGDGLLSLDSAAQGEWNRIRIYQPSLNVIAKLALGIADEPLLKVIQQKLMEGAVNIEILRLCNLSKIRQDSYKKLFLGYIDKIRSFGITVSDDGVQAAEGAPVTWQHKALTERDLLDIGKGSVVNVGRKCIVTSLAVDAARKKSIQICREGEVR